jgi:hypothetical protein
VEEMSFVELVVNIKEGTPIRDPGALQKWAGLRLCHRFLRKCGLKICTEKKV